MSGGRSAGCGAAGVIGRGAAGRDAMGAEPGGSGVDTHEASARLAAAAKTALRMQRKERFMCDPIP